MFVRIESKRKTGIQYSLSMSFSETVLRGCEIERGEAYERKVSLRDRRNRLHSHLAFGSMRPLFRPERVTQELNDADAASTKPRKKPGREMKIGDVREVEERKKNEKTTNGLLKLPQSCA